MIEVLTPRREKVSDAFWTWGPFLFASFVLGHMLAERLRVLEIPVEGPVAGLATAGLLAWAVCAAGYLLWLPLSWLRPGLSRRTVVRALAGPLGWSLLILVPLLSPLGPALSLAVAALAAAGGAFRRLRSRAGPWTGAAFVFAAGASALAFEGPRLLLEAFGPWLGLAAVAAAIPVAAAKLSFLGRPWRRFPERFGPALLAAALPWTAGAAWHGFIRPARLYRNGCLAPQALLGTDGTGGVYLRNRDGEVFHARGGSLERLGVSRRARLGRMRRGPGFDLALEFKPSGDRFLEFGPWGTRTLRPGGGAREALFAADYDVDGAFILAADARAPRLVWLDAGGRVLKAKLMPAESGLPRFVSVFRGKVHVWTDAGRLLRLGADGAWSLDPAPAPARAPGSPTKILDFIMSDAGPLLLAGSGREREVLRLASPSPGAPARWTAIRGAGAAARFAFDGSGRLYELERGAVVVSCVGCGSVPAPRLGAPEADLRAFRLSPGGRLIERLE